MARRLTSSGTGHHLRLSRPHLFAGPASTDGHVPEVWLINSPAREVNHYVDITETFDRKVASVGAHVEPPSFWGGFCQGGIPRDCG